MRFGIFPQQICPGAFEGLSLAPWRMMLRAVHGPDFNAVWVPTRMMGKVKGMNDKKVK